MSASNPKHNNGNGTHMNGTHANGSAGPAVNGSAGNGTARHATVADIAAMLDAEIVGNAQTLVTGVAGIESAVPGAILFIENEKRLAEAQSSDAAAIIVPSAVAAKVRRALRQGGKPA